MSPSILCKNLNSLLKADPQVIQECLDEFAAAGADIQGYDTRQSALDLKELRESLGISQWNVYGVSYGTRYALDLLRVDPKGTACVVLDSPMTTSDPNNTTDINLNMERVFNLMFDDCAAQSTCNAAYPNLRQKFYCGSGLYQAASDSPSGEKSGNGRDDASQQVERRLNRTDRQYHRFGELCESGPFPDRKNVQTRDRTVRHDIAETWIRISPTGTLRHSATPYTSESP